LRHEGGHLCGDPERRGLVGHDSERFFYYPTGPERTKGQVVEMFLGPRYPSGADVERALARNPGNMGRLFRRKARGKP